MMIHCRKLYSKKEKREFALGCICSGILGIYALIMLLLFMHTEAIVPDEPWFWRVASEQSISSISDYFKVQNELGYGAFYWLIMNKLVTRQATRLFSWVYLITVPVCMILVMKKYLNREWSNVIAALVLYLSSPMAWFTGKIVGPELMGNAIGAVGATFFLLKLAEINDEFYQKKQYKTIIVCVYTFLASVICGIAVGIKLYNVVFAIFISLVIFVDSLGLLPADHKLKKWFFYILPCAVAVVLGCVVGFFICNPFALSDMGLYFDNLGRFTVSSNDISEYTRRLDAMFVRKLIEWDLVNGGSMTHTMVSFVGLVGLVVVGIYNKESRNISIISSCSILAFLVVLLMSPVFCGWYLIPMLFLLPIMVNKKVLCWIVIAVNLIIMIPDVNYQLQSKLQHIENVSHQEEMYDLICVQEKKHPENEPLYYVDVNMKDFKMHFSSDHKGDRDEILFISERALNYEPVRKFYEYAMNGENGFSVVDQNEYFTTVLYEAK